METKLKTSPLNVVMLFMALMGLTSQTVFSQEKWEKNQEKRNKEIIIKWLDNFWGERYDPNIVDELASPDMRLQYSLHAPRKGHAQIKDFMKKFRDAFPDLAFEGAYPLLADGEYVIARWIGGGTHTGNSFNDWPVGTLPPQPGVKCGFPELPYLGW